MVQFVRRALHYASGSRKFLHQSTQPPVGGLIYCHPQTDFFIVSQLFGVASHAGRLKLGSKPGQFTVDLLSYSAANKYWNKLVHKKIYTLPKPECYQD